MHAASRDALAYISEYLDNNVNDGDNVVAVAAQTGSELFDVVEALDSDRALRVAVADASLSADQRSGLVSAVFAGKVSQFTLDLLIVAARQVWSSPREFRTGLVTLGRRALLRSADKQGQLLIVEDELFRISRLLDKEAQLTLRLDDRSADRVAKRDLLAKVLYGKVTAVTEALALQVIGRPENNAIDDLDSVSRFAASLWGREVAYVVSAAPLNDTQKQALADKLERIYGRAMSIHLEIDESLLGGMVIRVGDEVIDGSTSGKLERMRSNLV